MHLDSRSATIVATVLSTCALMAVTITLPLFFQKIQRTHTFLMANVYNCHQHSNDIWHQLAHNNVRTRRSPYGMGASKLKPGQCCSCQQGLPGKPGPQGPPGFDGKDGMIGVNGANGRNGRYMALEQSEEEKHCQKCGPAPPGPPGYPGSKGMRGLQGPQGVSGRDARPGLKGAQGPIGVRGLPGIIGSQGPPGDPGKVLNGAPQGVQGLSGKMGPRGRPGMPGRDGLAGREGLKGVRGFPGERGRAGVRGDPGPAGSVGPIGGKGSCSHCPASREAPSHIPPGVYTDPQTEYGELPDDHPNHPNNNNNLYESGSHLEHNNRPDVPLAPPTSPGYNTRNRGQQSKNQQSSRPASSSSTHSQSNSKPNYSSRSGSQSRFGTGKVERPSFDHSEPPPQGDSIESISPPIPDLPDKPRTIDFKRIQPTVPKHAGNYEPPGNSDEREREREYKSSAGTGRAPGYDTSQLEALGYAGMPPATPNQNRVNNNRGGSYGRKSSSPTAEHQSYDSASEQSSGTPSGYDTSASSTDSSQHQPLAHSQQPTGDYSSQTSSGGRQSAYSAPHSRHLQTKQGYNVQITRGSYGAMPVAQMLRQTPPNPFGKFPRAMSLSPPGSATAYRLL